MRQQDGEQDDNGSSVQILSTAAQTLGSVCCGYKHFKTPAHLRISPPEMAGRRNSCWSLSVIWRAVRAVKIHGDQLISALPERACLHRRHEHDLGIGGDASLRRPAAS